MKTKAKGNRIQLKAIKELELDGWLVSKVEKGGKFAVEKDMFGLFDVVAVRRGQCLFVQLTCNRNHPHTQYQEFSKEYHNNGISFEQWVWYDRKGWRKFKYLLGGIIEEDLRK